VGRKKERDRWSNLAIVVEFKNIRKLFPPLMTAYAISFLFLVVEIFYFTFTTKVISTH
jgi:hypothetical protein